MGEATLGLDFGPLPLAQQAAATSQASELGPAHQTTDELLATVVLPITPGLVPLARSPRTPPGPPRRPQGRSATATRRSHRVLNRKLAVTGGGNTMMKLARKLIVSKRGLAIAEKGEESDDETLHKYGATLRGSPLSPTQMAALTVLAKGASRKRRPAARSDQLVAPVQLSISSS